MCLSALLTTTMPMLDETIKSLEAAGLRENIKIMIGGAPVDQAFADQVGADMYTSNAAEAAEGIAKLLTA